MISQMSREDMVSPTSGFVGLGAVDSTCKQKVTDTDGPLGIPNMFNSEQNSMSFPSLLVLAANFDDELAKKHGNYVANQAHSPDVAG